MACCLVRNLPLATLNLRDTFDLGLAQVIGDEVSIELVVHLREGERPELTAGPFIVELDLLAGLA